MNVVPERRSIAVAYATSSADRPANLQEWLRERGIDCAVVRAETVDELHAVAADAAVHAVVVESTHAHAFDVLESASGIDSDPVSVFLAADASTEVVERAYDAGADDFVHDVGEASIEVVGHELEPTLSDAAGRIEPGTTGHLETIAETMSDAILTIDEDSVVRYANPAIADVLGYEPDEIVDESLTHLMHDDLAERHHAGLRAYLESGDRALDWNHVELPGVHADGHEVPLSISFSEFTTHGDRYFTGVLRDDTERKQLEAERDLYHDATQRIHQADSFEDGLQTALDAIGSATNWQYGEAWTATDDGSLERLAETYVESDAAREFARRVAHETFEPGDGLVGRIWTSGTHEWIADVTVDDAEFARADDAKAAGFHGTLGVPIVSDGTVHAALLFYDETSREPDDATVEATRAIAADLGHLMERLRVESAIREERSLKDRVLETSPVGIFILEPDGTFRYINDCAGDILGLGDYEGPVTFADLDVDPVTFDGEPIDDAYRPYQRVVERGETISGEARADVDGETRWLAVNGAPLTDEDGTVTSSVFSIQDVTEREQRTRRLEQYEAVMQTVSDGMYALDEDGRFVIVNDAYADMFGVSRAELVGAEASEFVPDRVVQDAKALQAEIEETGTREATLEATITASNGDQIPVDVRISLFDLGDDRYGHVGVVRDVSERKRREERLAKLNEIGQALTTAETPGEVADVVVEGALEALDCPLVDLQYYDAVDGELRSVRRSPALVDAVGDDDDPFLVDADVPWEVFATGEERVLATPTAATDVHPGVHVDVDITIDATDPAFSLGVAFPLGSHGAFVAGTADIDDFTDTDVRFARILVAHAVAALERVDREVELREKKAELQEYTESLERINRLNGVIRSLTRELTNASTREEIEAAVCEELTSADPYVFGWIGEQRAVADQVVPRVHAGREDGYLDAITIDTSDDVAAGPTRTAFRDREPAVQDNLQTDPPFEPWRTEALKRDYRSSIAVPLAYRDTLYGVLTLYADEPGVFDDMEVAVLGELGEMVGYAVNAIERKKALVSDATVELTFAFHDESVSAIRFAAETEATYEFDTLVEQGDGSIRAFFRVAGTDPETVYEYCRRSTTVESVSMLTEDEDAHRYEAVVSGSGFLGDLVAYGATPTEMRTSPTGGRVTVELPKGGDVTSFVRMFVREYDGAELVNRTEYDRPVQTREEFEATYRDRLTERQEEVLQTAYFSGFFEWPRETSGTELASKLGVSQPTVSRHIRKGERKLFSVVFDDE